MTKSLAILCGLFSLIAAPVETNAAVEVIAIETGGKVVFTGSGSINLAAFTTFRNVSLGLGIDPNHSPFPPGFGIGGVSPTAGTPAGRYGGGFTTFPATFGSGPFRSFNSVSGDIIGTGNNQLAPEISVPSNYQSGAMLSGSGTFLSQTFNSLGINPGTYVWAWGSGANADSLTLKIVPEPTTCAVALVGFCLVAIRKR